jgi:hypothetical protein
MPKGKKTRKVINKEYLNLNIGQILSNTLYKTKFGAGGHKWAA